MNRKLCCMALLCLIISQYCFAQNKLPDTVNYIIADSVLIKTTDGATLSAVVVRKKTDINKKLPTALMFFIYSNLQRSLMEAKTAADHGYVGIVADTRGKRLSPDSIEPYEHEPKDVNEVISWIIQQPWSDGRVGMYGGSYSGYAQWAATKYPHPALKTIVPYVAAIPGLGLPMENNVFINPNYQWAFYVTNNKYVDQAVNNDNQRWRKMRNNWYKGGQAYSKIDSIDGTPNPWFQKWIKHPSYDNYWQAMVPYKEDFKKINIPVLSITGYYDDGQISALHYLMEHYRYNATADHYLIIGPYDHFGAQVGGIAMLRQYQVDPIALINTREITFEWFDFIFKNGKKPKLLQDKINYQVMGTNEWKHAKSIAKMSDTSITFYLSNKKIDSNYLLAQDKPTITQQFIQQVDFNDRESLNGDYYPDPIVKKEIDRSNGLFFISAPFKQEISINGFITGSLKGIFNKKDLDICLTFYEMMSDGSYFNLSYFLGRASYQKDMSKRVLLKPGKIETINFERSRMVSKKLSKGSRLLVVLNVNKNPFAQINYGTGKNVSNETIADAKEPLSIRWLSDSFIRVPISY